MILGSDEAHRVHPDSASLDITDELAACLMAAGTNSDLSDQLATNGDFLVALNSGSSHPNYTSALEWLHSLIDMRDGKPKANREKRETPFETATRLRDEYWDTFRSVRDSNGENSDAGAYFAKLHITLGDRSPSDITNGEIQAAFKKLSRQKLHPDLWNSELSSSSEGKLLLSQMGALFQAINGARSELLGQKRSSYDRDLTLRRRQRQSTNGFRGTRSGVDGTAGQAGPSRGTQETHSTGTGRASSSSSGDARDAHQQREDEWSRQTREMKDESDIFMDKIRRKRQLSDMVFDLSRRILTECQEFISRDDLEIPTIEFGIDLSKKITQAVRSMTNSGYDSVAFRIESEFESSPHFRERMALMINEKLPWLQAVCSPDGSMSITYSLYPDSVPKNKAFEPRGGDKVRVQLDSGNIDTNWIFVNTTTDEGGSEVLVVRKKIGEEVLFKTITREKLEPLNRVARIGDIHEADNFFELFDILSRLDAPDLNYRKLLEQINQVAIGLEDISIIPQLGGVLRDKVSELISISSSRPTNPRNQSQSRNQNGWQKSAEMRARETWHTINTPGSPRYDDWQTKRDRKNRQQAEKREREQLGKSNPQEYRKKKFGLLSDRLKELNRRIIFEAESSADTDFAKRVSSEISSKFMTLFDQNDAVGFVVEVSDHAPPSLSFLLETVAKINRRADQGMTAICDPNGRKIHITLTVYPDENPENYFFSAQVGEVARVLRPDGSIDSNWTVVGKDYNLGGLFSEVTLGKNGKTTVVREQDLAAINKRVSIFDISTAHSFTLLFDFLRRIDSTTGDYPSYEYLADVINRVILGADPKYIPTAGGLRDKVLELIKQANF